MGTRINVLLDHDIPDNRGQAAVLARLEPTAPAALAVHEYRSYTGPGGLLLKVGPHAAKTRTAGRWRGFLGIPPLHQVHLRAFRDVARALGATRIAYFPDDDDLLMCSAARELLGTA